MPRLNKNQPKVSPYENGDIDMDDIVNTNKCKMSLRIDAKTIILVSPDKCNPEYAKAYKKKLDETVLLNGKLIS